MKNIIFDTETGGLNPFSSAICSISMKVCDEDIIKTWYIKKTDKREYNVEAMKINGLTFDYLNKHGMSEKDAIIDIISFLRANNGSCDTSFPWYNSVIIGHNVLFDIQFMDSLFARNGYPLFSRYTHPHKICTMIMINMLRLAGIVDIKSISLSNCYKFFFGVNFDNQHTSSADVIATEKLYKRIIKFVGEK